MAKLNFKLSDRQKHDAIWSLLNVNYNADADWAIDYGICDIYDEYALVVNYETGSFERVYYTKDDDADMVTLGEHEKCFILDVTEDEKKALEAIQAVNGTYEKIDEKFNAIESNLEVANNSLNEANEKVGKYEQKVEELNGANATLTTERDEAVGNYNAAQEQISALTEELDNLKEYKLQVEMQEKQTVINSYAELLSEEVLANYTGEKIASYTATDLDKELAYELKKSNPSVFSKEGAKLLPKDESPLTGLDALLAKYQKKD